MDNSELIHEIETQRKLMIEVATGRLDIQDANDDYKRRRHLIQNELKYRKINDPNPFTDLWKWYGKWRKDLPTYQSRREFLLDLYDPLVEEVQTSSTAFTFPQPMLLLVNELENFELKHQTYVTEFEYEQLVDSVLYAKVKALRAFLFEVDLPGAVDVIDQQDFQPGNAVMVLESVNSYVIPEIKRKISEQGLSEAVQDVAINLRHFLNTISDQSTVKFLEEAITCFESGLHRAAVIMSWVGAMSLLHKYVVQNQLAQFNVEANRRNPNWKPAKTTDDLGKMREFDFLDVLETLSIIGKNVKQELKSCLQLRNGCGHPNSLEVGQNKVAAHIEILILNVFAKFS